MLDSWLLLPPVLLTLKFMFLPWMNESSSSCLSTCVLLKESSSQNMTCQICVLATASDGLFYLSLSVDCSIATMRYSTWLVLWPPWMRELCHHSEALWNIVMKHMYGGFDAARQNGWSQSENIVRFLPSFFQFRFTCWTEEVQSVSLCSQTQKSQSIIK